MDYSGHLIKADQLMNRVYDLCQSNDYMNAMGLCLEAITEIKMAYNVLNHLSEHKDQMIGIWENK
jgi:hypothetical protein